MNKTGKNEIILHSTNITKDYVLGEKRLEVLKNVNISLRKGEIASILGISGSGKSTLLNILGTLDKPNKGKIKLDGIDVSTLGERELANFRNIKVGFVFQFHYLLPEFTALENAAMPGFICGLPRKQVLEKATEILNRVGLNERLDHKPSELSGGELQRVAIARALVNDPILVLADEPTGNLDRGNGESIYELILDLSKERYTTFLVVTHNESIANKTDKVYTLADGILNEM